MKKVGYIILFLIINFGGLAIGSWLMNNGPDSTWYINLNKAPWTPPGWVFGVAWTIIMICFSVYLAYLFSIRNSRYVRTLFITQVLLNVSWNYIFFNQHLVSWGLVTITALTFLIFYLFISFRDDQLSKMRYLLLPYMIWLVLATSLNAYIVFNN